MNSFVSVNECGKRLDQAPYVTAYSNEARIPLNLIMFHTDYTNSWLKPRKLCYERHNHDRVFKVKKTAWNFLELGLFSNKIFISIKSAAVKTSKYLTKICIHGAEYQGVVQTIQILVNFQRKYTIQVSVLGHCFEKPKSWPAHGYW